MVPLKVLERINDNTCKAELPGDYGSSTTFNLIDLGTYLDDVPLEDLRANPLQQGKANGDPSTETNPSQNV